MGLVGKECRRMVRDGEVEGVVEVMEVLAGSEFPIKKLVKPNDIIARCIDKRIPDIAVRYASLFPHAHVLVCTTIKEFGMRRDLISALTAFEASEQKIGNNKMLVYRTIIDACGLCGDYFRSRSIYEDLLAREVIPNIYVFNSLMNTNAPDVSYSIDVYKKMKNLGVIPDMASYNILLKSCCLAGRVDLAQDIYKEVKRLEFKGALKLDLFTYSTLIKNAIEDEASSSGVSIVINASSMSSATSTATSTAEAPAFCAFQKAKSQVSMHSRKQNLRIWNTNLQAPAFCAFQNPDLQSKKAIWRHAPEKQTLFPTWQHRRKV